MRRARRPARLARGAAAGLCVALSSCTLLIDGPNLRVPENRCDVDTDCIAEARCELTIQRCVARAAPAYELRVEITPSRDPLGDDPAPMLFDVGALGDASPTTFVAPAQVPVQGTVRYRGEPISAELTFVRRPAPEGEALHGALSGTVAVRAQPVSTGSVDFVTQLPGGTSYDVYVEPQSEHRALLPPLSATLDVPESAGVSFAIEYAEHELVDVRGVVLDSAGNPGVGLLVRMIDPASGRSLSSTIETDEEGRFSLVALAGLESFAFRIRGDASRADASTLLPRITIDANSLVPDERGAFTLLIPNTDRSLRLEGRVELPPSLGMNAPARGAQVRLDAPFVVDPETGLGGSLDLDLTTDSEGRFVGRVLPGDYRVEIVSSDAGVGVLVSSLEVIANPSGMLLGQLYTLPERSIVGGTVELSDGEPMRQVTVRAEALGIELPDGSSAAARLNRTLTGLTGTMGEFRLPLDVGVYDLIVEVPPSSGYGWLVERDFVVERGAMPLRRSLVVRPPHRFVAHAEFAEGSPIVDARVRAFARHPETGRMIQVAEGSTDASGQLEVLLPASID